LEPPSFNFYPMAEASGDTAMEEMQRFYRRLNQFVDNYAPEGRGKTCEEGVLSSDLVEE